MAESYDVVVVGTGFASTFFLHRYLAGREGGRVLVLERGKMNSHRDQGDGRRAELKREARASYTNRNPEKPWIFLLTFGGGSNCWFGNTPRMLPDDFRLRSRYGVGADWPVSYEELEPYYCDAEEMMAVAGPSDDSPFPRSRPYPQPPHRFSDVDRRVKESYPEHMFVMPAARPTRATAKRPVCCVNAACSYCPIDSKFTILNELEELYHDPRVTLVTGAAVQAVEVEGGTRATGVVYLQDGAERRAKGELVVLGANTLFNPHILLRSGLDHPELGRGLVEQASRDAIVHLDGIDNFGGSTTAVGHGYMVYNGAHRARRAAGLVEFWNGPQLRNERGKWRQLATIRIVYEDLRQPENRVTVSSEDPTRPEVTFTDYSPYARAGLRAFEADLERVLAPLPVEEVAAITSADTESHILGTTVMGDDPARSVVDRHSVHHQVRNLLVLGGSTFPTAAPANPTLTLSALALRSADHVLGRPART